MTGREVAEHLDRIINTRRDHRRGHPEQHLHVVSQRGDELNVALFDGPNPVQWFRIEVHELEDAVP
jgi:hypothetical protein